MDLRLVVIAAQCKPHPGLAGVLSAFEWVVVADEDHCAPGLWYPLQPLRKVGDETSGIIEGPGRLVLLLYPLYLDVCPFLTFSDVYSRIHPHVPLAFLCVEEEVLHRHIHLVQVINLYSGQGRDCVCRVPLVLEYPNHWKVEEVQVVDGALKRCVFY